MISNIMHPEKFLNSICNFVDTDEILSLNCKKGFLEKLLQLSGKSVIACYNGCLDDIFVDVCILGAEEAISAFPTNVLLFQSEITNTELQLFTGNKLIYIGNNDTCVPNHLLEQLDKDWEQVPIESFDNNLLFYKRK